MPEMSERSFLFIPPQVFPPIWRKIRDSRDYALVDRVWKAVESSLNLRRLLTRANRCSTSIVDRLSRRARKADIRRKILIGATVFARIDAHEMDHTELAAWLSKHLSRDDDRALFELPPKGTTLRP
jgi:hypothetical protein